MSNYLRQVYDFNDEDVVNTYDELSLWAAPFGMLLLERLKLKPKLTVLDIGCGVGFPLLEIAQRLGNSSMVYGIDPWEKAFKRIRLKANLYGLENINLINAKAEELPFQDEFFDLIISNNGINNVENEEKSINEAYRVLASQGQMLITINLPETMFEFYNIFFEVLEYLDKHEEIERLKKHINVKRKSITEMTNMLKHAGFDNIKVTEREFAMRFVNGSAMFNYYFIKLYFLKPWKDILAGKEVEKVFSLLECRLNNLAEKEGEIKLTVPFACFDCEK